MGEMNWLAEAQKRSIEGFIHPLELQKLSELASGKDVLEIGSFKGLSAWCMAQTAKSVTAIDTFEAASDGQRQTGQYTTLDAFKHAISGCSNVTFHVNTSEQAVQHLSGQQFDLIFLDAMHTYQDVQSDILRWWPHVRSGGIMALHDYGHDHFPGVKEAADDIFLRRPDEDQVVTLAWWSKE